MPSPPLSYTPRHLAEKILTSRAALEGERKPVTVLFCDLANSTPLAERLGPEAMHTLLNHFFELALAEVHRYEGTINQFLGDGFMALFGAPLAVEDHARRALLAALEIQQGMHELRADVAPHAGVELAVRLGLNTGLVVVGRIGDNRLHEDLKAVLQMASVIGRVFSHPLLAHVLPQDLELDTVLLELADLEFVYVTSLAPQREYSFKHVLTQEAVYQTLLRPKREEYHERIGKALEALYSHRLEEYYEVLAYHYVRSGNKDKAVGYLDLANQKAAKANAMEEARAYFEEAMQLLDTLPETAGNHQQRISLLVSQMAMMLLLLKTPEYYDLLTRHEVMAVGLGNPRLLGAFYGRMGFCEYSFGDYDQAIQTLSKAAAFCEAAGNAEDAGQAYAAAGWCHMYKGDYDQVLALREPARRVMEQRFNILWYTWSLVTISWAYACLGRWDDAEKEGQNALRMGEEFSEDSVMSHAAWVLSMVHASKGDLVRALEYSALGVQKAPTPGDKGWAQGFYAWSLCRAGEPHRGIELLAEAVAINRTGRHVPAVIFFMLLLAEGYWLAGEYDNARQTLEESLELAERCGMRFVVGSAHRFLGEIALHTNPAQTSAPLAAPHFEQSIATLRGINPENELALAYAGYGRLHLQQGHIVQAREYLTRALEIFHRLGALREPDRVRQTLAELPEG